LADLLHRVLAEIRERLDASREAVHEYRRLEAALAALDSPTGSPSAGTDRAPAARPARSNGASDRRSTPTRKRAPRGANRQAVMRVVGERPGITTSELAAASGVEKRTLYTLLSTLTKQRALERQELPGGQTGYRVHEHETAEARTSRDDPDAVTAPTDG
jgi:hypothetical protein